MTSSADPDDEGRVTGIPDEAPTGNDEPGSSPAPATEQPAAGGNAVGQPAPGEGAPDSH